MVEMLALTSRYNVVACRDAIPMENCRPGKPRARAAWATPWRSLAEKGPVRGSQPFTEYVSVRITGKIVPKWPGHEGKVGKIVDSLQEPFSALNFRPCCFEKSDWRTAFDTAAVRSEAAPAELN